MPTRDLPRIFALARADDDGVRCVEDRLRGSVVALQRHDPGRRCDPLRELEDVAHPGRPEAVDALRVLADHGQTIPHGLEPEQDAFLQTIGILVLVDEHVVEARRHVSGD